MTQNAENSSTELTQNADISAHSNLPENYSKHQDLFFPPDTSNNVLPILRRRKTLAFGVSLLCFSIGLLAINSAKPIYRTHAQLAFPDQSAAFIETQLHIISNTKLPHILKQQQRSKHQAGAPNIHERFKSFAQENVHNLAQHSPFSVKSPSKTHPLMSSGHVHATHIPNSYVVDISYDSNDAVQSALGLNRFINTYMRQIKQTHGPSAKNKTAHILDAPEYQKAQKHYQELKIRLAAFIKSDGKLNVHNNEKALESLRSGLLDELLERNRGYSYELENLSLRYGKKHPKIIDMRAEVSTLKEQIKQEREALLANLIDEYISAKKIRNALEKTAALQDEQRGERNAQHIAPQDVVQLIEPAKPTHSPIFPNKPRLIGLSALISLLLGLLIPIIVERRRKTFLSGRQISHKFGLPCLALIPETKKDDDESLADYVLSYPSSTLAEAVRSLRLNIRLKSADPAKENKVVVVTSSRGEEGKTTLCAWLGRLAAKSGEKVLLIDANLRTPSIHQTLDSMNTMSLIEHLTGKAALSEIIDKTTDPSGLHIIYGRAAPNSALDLLSTKKMAQLIADVKSSYDLVIIDTPSCLTNADARALSAHADLLLYLISWNKTKRDVIHRGLLQFLNFTHIRTALVLSNINLRKHVEYGYGEIVYEEQA